MADDRDRQRRKLHAWLGDVEPAWSLLGPQTIAALCSLPPQLDRVMTIVSDLAVDEIAGAPGVAATASLLGHTRDAGGLKLTANGYLTRAAVAEIAAGPDWAAFQLASVFELSTAVSEADLLPLHFLHRVAQAAGLVRKRHGRLEITRRGVAMLAPDQRPTLLALLLRNALWKVNLAYFDQAGLGQWPQPMIGLVLWGLSVAAADWLPRDKLTRLCAIPVDGVLDVYPMVPDHAFELRALRPLEWFGLVERQQAPTEDPAPPARYRKSALFDRLLRFHVPVETAAGPRH
jgi:hypothetical protein